MRKRYVQTSLSLSLSRTNEKNDKRRTTFQVKSIVRDVDTDEDNSILGTAFELMRRYRKSSWYKEYTDMYNEAVFEINRDALSEALKRFDVLTRVRRGLPITETKNITDFQNTNRCNHKPNNGTRHFKVKFLPSRILCHFPPTPSPPPQIRRSP